MNPEVSLSRTIRVVNGLNKLKRGFALINSNSCEPCTCVSMFPSAARTIPVDPGIAFAKIIRPARQRVKTPFSALSRKPSLDDAVLPF